MKQENPGGDRHWNKKYLDISLAKTLNYILYEQNRLGMDSDSQEITYQFLIDLLSFNMMTKRKVILYFDYEVIVTEQNKILGEEQDYFRRLAEDLVNKYSQNYPQESTYNNVEELLSILELSSNVRDLKLIKKQYKVLSPGARHHSKFLVSQNVSREYISKEYSRSLELC